MNKKNRSVIRKWWPWVCIVDDSMVVTLSLVSNGANMDPTSRFNFKENNIACCAKRDHQFTDKRTAVCFAAAKRADRQKRAPLPNGLNRARWNFKIASRTVQFTLKGKIKYSFEIFFGLAAEYDLIHHWGCFF